MLLRITWPRPAQQVRAACGYVWFLISAGAYPATGMFPSLVLLGGGFAFGYGAIMAQATEGIDDSEQGLASGVVQTSSQVGGALVLAVLTAVLADAYCGSGAPARPCNRRRHRQRTDPRPGVDMPFS